MRRSIIAMNSKKGVHKQPPASPLHAAADNAYARNEVPPPLPSEPSWETQKRLGNELAGKAKYLSDAQWEQIPLREKAYFTKVVADKIKHSPAEVSEQQRRRYYETTTHNVNFDAQYITNPYQRMKVGLPFELDTHGRTITVSEAMMEQADEADFDPHNAKNIEYAQMHFKQAFKDYVANRKAGRSTEAERRKIASMAESLQHEVQKHLANMYKYADARLHEAVKTQGLSRLQSLARARSRAEKVLNDEVVEARPNKLSRVDRLAKKYGLNVKLAETMWQAFKAQEDFFEKLEVLNRLTSGRGFSHTPADEKLSDYTDRLSQMLSLDPNKAATLDVVKYFAQLETCEPTDWARRWYENNLMYPLQSTPEYQHLVALSTTSEASPVLRSAAQDRVTAVKSFSEMVVSGTPTTSLQQQRVRHLAYAYMQVQIRRMRAKCVKYEGVEMSEEAQRAQKLCRLMKDLGNDFSNPTVVEHHCEVMGLVSAVVAKYQQEGDPAAAAARVSTAIASGDAGKISNEVRRVERKKMAEQVLRMVRILEDDVRDDIRWQEDFEDAERPALIPEPEPFLYVSAADALALRSIHDRDMSVRGNPFQKKQWNMSLLGKKIDLPTQPLLFWGTGVAAVEQALALAVEEAHERRRQETEKTPRADEEKNPWGWRRQNDILD